MRRQGITVCLALPLLAALLAGCTEEAPHAWVVQPVAEGDAWAYSVTVTDDPKAHDETLEVAGVTHVPWAGGARPVAIRVGARDRGPASFAEFLAPGPATTLGRTFFQPDVRTEEVWEADCPVLPSTLQPPHAESATCRQRIQVHGPGATPDEETLMLIFERLTIDFTVGAVETVTVPAGTFAAVRIDVAYHSDALDAFVGRPPPTMWYSPEACGVVREATDLRIRELTAFRCAATQRSSGMVAALADADRVADEAVAAFGPDPVVASCFIPYSGVGAGPAEADPLGLDCRMPNGVAGGALRTAEALRIEATWEDRTVPVAAVHLVAAGKETSGSSAPLQLEIAAAGLDPETFRASVYADGPAVYDEFRLTFHVLPVPAGPGLPF